MHTVESSEVVGTLGYAQAGHCRPERYERMGAVLKGPMHVRVEAVHVGLVQKE